MKFAPVSTDLLIKLGLAAGAVIAVYFVVTRAAKVGSKVADSINPTNHDNVFATGVNGIGASMTGDKNFSLGGWIYDLTHSDPAAALPAEDNSPFGIKPSESTSWD